MTLEHTIIFILILLSRVLTANKVDKSWNGEGKWENKKRKQRKNTVGITLETTVQ